MEPEIDPHFIQHYSNTLYTVQLNIAQYSRLDSPSTHSFN